MPGTPASDRLASGECRISVANVFSADRLSIAELVLLSEDARTVYEVSASRKSCPVVGSFTNRNFPFRRPTKSEDISKASIHQMRQLPHLLICQSA